ncbi:hypothetical protein [Zunongwangia sp. H14]|uniref:hypothetical protein n=1 Tax=Zunongwangia sp. H14 TaxID=3240792 RepID=UPI003561C32A
MGTANNYLPVHIGSLRDHLCSSMGVNVTFDPFTFQVMVVLSSAITRIGPIGFTRSNLPGAAAV